MKLPDLLRELEAEQKIKLGAADGVGYFYIGTAGDLLDRLDDYNAQAYRIAEGYYKRAKRNLEAALAATCTPNLYAQKEITSIVPDISVAGYEGYLREFFTNVLAEKQRFERAQVYLESYRKLDARQVEETRDADKAVDPEYKIVLVSGYERGKYWFADEATMKPSMRFVQLLEA